ncbi:MAG: 50S ribosomal protein L24, partial [Candidatus Fonsibacter ubiquis]
TRPNPAKNIQGGIVSKEMPLNISNVALLNSLTQKADRVGIKKLDDGKKIRVFKSNNEAVDA